MKLRSLPFLLALTLLCLQGFGQLTGNYKFPANITYNNGFMPAGKDAQKALDAYNSWKTNFVEASTCETNSFRVKFDAASNADHTVSEGIGYGMLLAAYAGDKPLLDGLFAFYNKFRNAQPNGVMHWKVSKTCTIIQQNGATDAELDVAMALVVASWQWEGGSGAYMTAAKAMIQTIKSLEIEGSTLKPGDKFGGKNGDNDLVNPSYFAPAYYRVFGQITNDVAFWNGVATEGYRILNLASNPLTGLVPDWVKGSNGQFSTSSIVKNYYNNGQSFYYDAVRAPWRTAIDYLWWGTPEAKAYSEKLSDWVITSVGGIANLHTEYAIDGTAKNTFHNNSFVGPFAVAAMATDRTDPKYKTYLNAAYNDNVTTNPGAGEYFNASLKALTLFTLTGNFYLPPPDVCDAPVLGSNVSLCKTGVLLDSKLAAANRTFVWRNNGTIIAGATGPTYTPTTAGTYEITSTEGKCIRKSQVEVYPATLIPDFSFVNTAGSVAFTDNTPGAASYSWNFGDATAVSIEKNPVHNYAKTGLFNVVLTVKDACDKTTTKTIAVTIGADGANGGWVEDVFTNYLTAAPWSAVPAIVVKPVCSELIATATAPGQYDPFGITFKKGGDDTPQDLSKYPYVRIRIKSSVKTPTGGTPANKGLRVDLGDISLDCDGATSTAKNPCTTSKVATYITFPDTTYQIITLDFRNKFIDYTGNKVDSAHIKQIAFTPSDQGPFTGKITIDWVIAGYANLPAPALAVADPKICAGATAKLNAYTCNGTPTATYKWSTGETTPAITAGSGTYFVQATNFGGTSYDTVNVLITPAPKSGFSSISEGHLATFTNQSTNATTRTWYFGDSAKSVSAAANPTHTYAKAGTYTISLATKGTCGTDSIAQDIIILDPTSVDLSNYVEGISLQPNPFSNNVALMINASSTIEMDVRVNDLSGKLVDAFSTSTNQLTNFGNTLKDGIYTVHISYGNLSKTIKVVKLQ